MLPQKTVKELIAKDTMHQCPPEAYGGVCVKIAAAAKLPTRFGNFQIVSFTNNRDATKEHVAIVKGDICDATDIPTRLHSECLTGDALGSLRCDCRDQLITALKHVGNQEQGLILYLRQEGRGIGLVNKIKAYALQDQGMDTVEADRALGFSGDEREYDIAAHMLSSLMVRSIQLMTNNPKKIEDLQQHGVEVSGRIPLIIPANAYNKVYLETKKNKAGHLLERRQLSEKELEQQEQIVVENGSTE